MDADRVRLVFWTSIIVIGGLGFWLYASSPADDGGRARWRQWAAWGVPLAAALFRQFFHFRWYGVKTSEDAADDMSTPVTPNSTAEPVRTPAEPAEPLPVRAQTHQIEPVEPAKNEPVREPAAIAITARLERAELITLLAVQKNADGGYTFSSNKITEFVGGTASEVKAQIAMIRNPTAPKPAAQNERGKTLRRPAEGW